MSDVPLQTMGNKLWDWVTRWMLTAAAVWVAALVVTGIWYDDAESLLAAALILGILNSLVKPVLVRVALPLVILSLGFMLLVINAFLLVVTTRLVPGFHVSGFWSAVGGSVIISVVSFLLGNRGGAGRMHMRPPPRPEDPAYSEPTRIHRPPPGKGPIIDV